MKLFSSANRIASYRAGLDPLIQRLQAYDRLRLKIETRGGLLSELQQITGMLSAPVEIDLDDPYQGSLHEPDALKRTLLFGSSFDLIFDVRQLDTGMPVFYLCRVQRDFWAEYSLVVEDLYRSPGYPLLDDRFVKLMPGTHERYHLRLSPFREGVKLALAKNNDATETSIDEYLYLAARNVYQSAWHEDQLPAVLCARHFHLPHLKRAIELLYICLSGDLFDLRNSVNDDLLHFFEHIDPNENVVALLRLLLTLDGATIADIPSKALRLYCKLNQGFSRFLKTQVAWGPSHTSLPLYKLVFANFSRLDVIASALKKEKTLAQASNKLESDAKAVMDAIHTIRQ